MAQQTIAEVVKRYLTDRNLSLREFADELNTILRPHHYTYTYAAVDQWVHGRRRPLIPAMVMLRDRTAPDDWRHAFAGEILAAEGMEWRQGVTA
jgi:transcriptional regulator with XRE-family HTH domain